MSEVSVGRSRVGPGPSGPPPPCPAILVDSRMRIGIPPGQRSKRNSFGFTFDEAIRARCFSHFRLSECDETNSAQTLEGGARSVAIATSEQRARSQDERVCVYLRRAPGFAVCSPGEVHRPPSLRQGQRKCSLAPLDRSFSLSTRSVRSCFLSVPRAPTLTSPLRPLFLPLPLFLRSSGSPPAAESRDAARPVTPLFAMTLFPRLYRALPLHCREKPTHGGRVSFLAVHGLGLQHLRAAAMIERIPRLVNSASKSRTAYGICCPRN